MTAFLGVTTSPAGSGLAPRLTVLVVLAVVLAELDATVEA
jgi:hypothetical protein